MAKRKYIDWDSVEPLYRAGSLSIHKICDQYEADHVNSQVWKKTIHHTAIIKKAKQLGWTRNLAKKVKDRIKEKLVTSLVTSGEQNKSLSDNDIIEQAAEVGSNVVLRHRKEIFDLLKYEADFLKELSEKPKKLYLSTFQGVILEKEVGLTVTEKSVTLKNLAAVRAQRITLERQAHSIDTDDEKEDYEERLRELMK